jgi:hypothetical protein
MKRPDLKARTMSLLGSARVSRAGDDVLAIADFSSVFHTLPDVSTSKVRFGETPKPARETRALPNLLNDAYDH